MQMFRLGIECRNGCNPDEDGVEVDGGYGDLDVYCATCLDHVAVTDEQYDMIEAELSALALGEGSR